MSSVQTGIDAVWSGEAAAITAARRATRGHVKKSARPQMATRGVTKTYHRGRNPVPDTGSYQAWAA